MAKQNGLIKRANKINNSDFTKVEKVHPRIVLKKCHTIIKDNAHPISEQIFLSVSVVEFHSPNIAQESMTVKFNNLS